MGAEEGDGNSRVWDGGLEDVQHAVARLVPGLERELLSVQDHDVLQAVGSGSRQLLVILGEGEMMQ